MTIRLACIAAAVVAVGFVNRAAADGMSIILELEGTLTESRNQFVLSVENEGTWALDLNPANRDFARDNLKKSANVRVHVQGAVSVRTANNQLTLVDRTIRVVTFSVGKPSGLKVTKIVAGSPAENKILVNDIIVEIAGKSITSRERLLEALAPLRGREITVIVIRDGLSRKIDGIALRANDATLGVFADPVLSWLEGGVFLPTDPGPPGRSPNP